MAAGSMLGFPTVTPWKMRERPEAALHSFPGRTREPE